MSPEPMQDSIGDYIIVKEERVRLPRESPSPAWGRRRSITGSPPRCALNARPVGRWQLHRAGARCARRELRDSAPPLVLDQLAHPARGPQPAGVAERHGSALERLLDFPQLARAQFGLTPGPSSLPQPPARPDCASCRAQRITYCRWTPCRRATSLWLTPCLNNSAAAIRRRSSLSKSRRTLTALAIISYHMYLYYASVNSTNSSMTGH